jgi:hypothetical protein
VKHGLSESEIAWQSRPFVNTGRFWGAALVACTVVPYYLWHLGLASAVMFIPYLIVAAGVGVLVVVVRRLLRPPQPYLEQTFIEITPGGIWRTTPNARVLILAAPQVQQVRVFRSRFRKIVRIEIASESESTPFVGLGDMQAFLNDVRSTFVRCELMDGEMAEHSSTA